MSRLDTLILSTIEFTGFIALWALLAPVPGALWLAAVCLLGFTWPALLLGFCVRPRQTASPARKAHFTRMLMIYSLMCFLLLDIFVILAIAEWRNPLWFGVPPVLVLSLALVGIRPLLYEPKGRTAQKISPV